MGDVGTIVTVVVAVYTIGSGVTVAMFYLFKSGNDEKFGSLDEKVKYDREEFKDENRNTAKALERADDYRIAQMTQSHGRIDSTKDMLSEVAQRVAYQEGYRQGVKDGIERAKLNK